jgi:1-acyl-sn-glycerol-3-phosphate acyltransferase
MHAPQISKSILAFFRHIVRGYFRRHFRAVRIANPKAFTSLPTSTPLIVYANHSSWWDPMVLVLLADRLMPRRSHFAPMDAAALKRYPILKRIGIFPVEMKTPRGAAQFLRTSLALLAQNAVLWITPQGRFADARERPLAFKPGLASLAAKAPKGCTLLPLAIEYVFWDERLPDTLLQFGEPIYILHGETAEAVEQLLTAALLETMEALKHKAIARDPAAFEILHTGRVGVGGFYELGQRLLAKLRRRPYQPAHTPPPLAAQKPRG